MSEKLPTVRATKDGILRLTIREIQNELMLATNPQTEFKILHDSISQIVKRFELRAQRAAAKKALYQFGILYNNNFNAEEWIEVNYPAPGGETDE